MKRKALTAQDIAALSEGGAVVGTSTDPVVEAPETVEGTPEAAAETSAGTTETVETAPETGAETSAATDQSALVAYLQSQIVDKDKALLEANLELRQVRKEHEEFAAVVDALAAVVANSVSNLSVALGGVASDVSSMTHAALLVEHGRLSDQFKTNFKAGGVAAVDAADTTGESEVRVDPLQRARLAAVRSTAKAK